MKVHKTCHSPKNNERVQADSEAQLYQDRGGLGKAGTQSFRQFHFRGDFQIYKEDEEVKSLFSFDPEQENQSQELRS